MEALKFTFSSLMTEDEATKQAISQAQLAISKKWDCLWIEGESGTGKTLLAHTICAQQERLATLLGTRHITLTSANFATLNILDTLSSDEQIIVYVSISEYAKKEELEKFHNMMVEKLHERQLSPALLVFMTTNNSHYSPEVRKYLRLLQSIFLETPLAHIRLPSLREKKNDIALLARYFLRQFSRRHKLTDGAAEALKLYDWKNNIKCLQLMCFKLAQNDETEIIYARHISKAYQEMYSTESDDSSYDDGVISKENIMINLLDNEGNLRRFQDLEEEIYARACHFKRGCKSSAARDLGVGRTTLYRKLKHI
jgi:DNA-binding NtrC family response regulator